MFSKLKTSALLVATVSSCAFLITGCGGSVGSSPPALAFSLPVAEGAYSGMLSNALEITTIVLENDVIYMFYGKTVNGTYNINGFFQGGGKSSAGIFTASDMKDYYYSGPALSGSLNANYMTSGSFNGSLVDGGTTFTFTGTTLNPVPYNYQAKANLANIAGAWTITDIAGIPTAITVAADGAVASSGAGCATSGSISPRASGKNVFDVSLKFGAAPCVFAGQSANGIGIEYVLTNGKRQLLLAVANTARTNGSVYFGLR